MVIMVLTLQHSSELGRLEERTRTLAEEIVQEALIRAVRGWPSYRGEAEYTKILGVCTGGFERFFQALGELTDERDVPLTEPFTPSPEQMQEAFSRYRNIPLPDYRWEEA